MQRLLMKLAQAGSLTRRIDPGSVAFGGTLFFCVGMLAFRSPAFGSVVNPWVATWHVLAYQDGVFRRALTGSILRLATGGEPLREAWIAGLSYCTFMLFALTAASIARAVIRRYPSDPRGILCLVLVVFGPTGAPLLAQQLGRQDVLILLAFAWVAGASTMRRGSWRSVVMAVGSIFGMLAHEAYLVLMIPTVLAVLFMTGAPNGKRRLFFDWGTAVVPPVIVGLAIAMAPSVEGIALTDLVTARAAFEPAPRAILRMQMTLWGNLEATRAVTSAHWCRIGGRLLGSTLLLTPLFVCGCLILRREARLNSWRYPLAVAATCSPVLLFPVAVDWGRWVAFSVFNVGALGLVSMLSAASPCRTENPHDGRLYLAAAGYGLCLTTFFVGMFEVAYGLHVRGWSSVVEHVCAFGCG